MWPCLRKFESCSRHRTIERRPGDRRAFAFLRAVRGSLRPWRRRGLEDRRASRELEPLPCAARARSCLRRWLPAAGARSRRSRCRSPRWYGSAERASPSRFVPPSRWRVVGRARRSRVARRRRWSGPRPSHWHRATPGRPGRLSLDRACRERSSPGAAALGLRLPAVGSRPACCADRRRTPSCGRVRVDGRPAALPGRWGGRRARAVAVSGRRQPLSSRAAGGSATGRARRRRPPGEAGPLSPARWRRVGVAGEACRRRPRRAPRVARGRCRWRSRRCGGRPLPSVCQRRSREIGIEPAPCPAAAERGLAGAALRRAARGRPPTSGAGHRGGAAAEPAMRPRGSGACGRRSRDALCAPAPARGRGGAATAHALGRARGQHRRGAAAEQARAARRAAAGHRAAPAPAPTTPCSSATAVAARQARGEQRELAPAHVSVDLEVAAAVARAQVRAHAAGAHRAAVAVGDRAADVLAGDLAALAVLGQRRARLEDGLAGGARGDAQRAGDLVVGRAPLTSRIISAPRWRSGSSCRSSTSWTAARAATTSRSTPATGGETASVSGSLGRRRRSSEIDSLWAMRNSQGFSAQLAVLAAAERGERLEHRVLQRVAGVVGVADDRAAVRVQRRVVAGVDGPERLRSFRQRPAAAGAHRRAAAGAGGRAGVGAQGEGFHAHSTRKQRGRANPVRRLLRETRKSRRPAARRRARRTARTRRAAAAPRAATRASSACGSRSGGCARA